MPLVKLPDVSIYYEWVGAEEKPVLIFSNSLGSNLHMWAGQVDAFKKHFRLLRYDKRGHGQSGVAAGPYTVEQLGWDVLRLLDALKVARVYFCGLSIGGMTGMFLATTAPDRFHRMALCNTAAKIGTVEAWNARIKAVESGGMKAVASAVIERWLTPNYRVSHPAETQAVLQMLEAANQEGYMACCAAVRDTDQRQGLTAIRVPCLVLAGRHDTSTTPADAHFLAQNILGSEYAEVSSAHLSNIEARDDFNRQVLQFLLR